MTKFMAGGLRVNPLKILLTGCYPKLNGVKKVYSAVILFSLVSF